MPTTTSKRRISPARIEYRRQHVNDWKNSGLGMGAYCEKAGIAKNSLRSWKRQSEADDVDETAPVVVPVPWQRIQACGEQPAPAPLRLHIGRRFQVEIGGDFNSSVLEKLVRMLELLA